MSKLKQDIEDSLVELVDQGYKIDVKNNKDVFSIHIRTPYFSGEKIDELEDYLHQCYDFMEMDKYSVFEVTINYSQTYYVKRLDKDKGRIIDIDINDLKVNDWEELWDSIDFCLFSTPDRNLYNSIKLDFKR
jgi:flavodoxin